MTTLTTLFGMVPLAVSRQVGAEVWNPLGITMIGGLTVSTLVTLVLIPTIYYMFERRKKTGFEDSRGRGVMFERRKKTGFEGSRGRGVRG